MSKNIATASKALTAELEAGHASQDDLSAYFAGLDGLIEQVRAVKALYKKELAVEASRRSRTKKRVELDAMKRRLAELEAGK